MRQLYRFSRDVDMQSAVNINILFLDQLEAILQGMISVVSTDIQPKSFTILYEITQDGLHYCKTENIEEVVFLDLMADTFDIVCKYSSLFPIEHNFKNYEELQATIMMFASWVLFHLEQETYHKLTKVEFNKLRRKDGNSKIISGNDGFRNSK